jgi:hypothetical protein
MMHCRMCSQRLPRPGRLCRECEQELELAHSARQTAGPVQGTHPDELYLAGLCGWKRFPSRPIVVIAAFVVGVSAAAAVYGLRNSSNAGESVMIDRYHATRVARPPTIAESTPSVPAAPALVRVTVVSPGAQNAIDASVESAAQPEHRTFDRVLGLADALDACAREHYFERLACEVRARARYCEGATATIPQCGQAASRE